MTKPLSNLWKNCNQMQSRKGILNLCWTLPADVAFLFLWQEQHLSIQLLWAKGPVTEREILDIWKYIIIQLYLGYCSNLEINMLNDASFAGNRICTRVFFSYFLAWSPQLPNFLLLGTGFLIAHFFPLVPEKHHILVDWCKIYWHLFTACP